MVQGRTALHRAAMLGRLEVTLALLEEAGDVNVLCSAELEITQSPVFHLLFSWLFFNESLISESRAGCGERECKGDRRDGG